MDGERELPKRQRKQVDICARSLALPQTTAAEKQSTVLKVKKARVKPQARLSAFLIHYSIMRVVCGYAPYISQSDIVMHELLNADLLSWYC